MKSPFQEPIIDISGESCGANKIYVRLVVQKMIPNMIVHWVDNREIWASRNYSLYTSKDDGVSFNKVADLEVSPFICMLGKFRLLSRAFRLGIRDLKKLRSGTILLIAYRKIFRLKDGESEAVYSFRRGFGPLREGWCEDNKGNCYIAEYFLNNKRDMPVNLLRSNDDGQSWEIIQSFQRIRHIHCVQYDPVGESIWLGTGDRDNESCILFSEDEGKTWSKIGAGNQMFRAVSLLFTKDYVYWGSDAPTRQNYVYRYVRKSGEIERLVAVDGPVHYSTTLENGIIIFATTAEGNSEGKSAEWDNKAHIWASEDGAHWIDLISWEKDFWPYILGFGRVLFAHGRCGDNLYFTTQSLKKVDNSLFCAKLQVENQKTCEL